MSKLKIAELFYSIQGEGRYMGVPSVFLRTFGCNFKCSGFGMPTGKASQEVEAIAARITEFKDYTELPLVSTGCDSYASWDPRFKDLSPMLESNAIVNRIMEILPQKRWEDEHLVITGGEPLLGWQRAYPDLLSHASMNKLKEITFETNGTQKLTPEFAAYLHTWSFVWVIKSSMYFMTLVIPLKTNAVSLLKLAGAPCNPMVLRDHLNCVLRNGIVNAV
jgi:organic radical activating enzyme